MEADRDHCTYLSCLFVCLSLGSCFLANSTQDGVEVWKKDVTDGVCVKGVAHLPVPAGMFIWFIKQV